MQCIITEKQSNQIYARWWYKEKDTNHPIKALRQSRQWVWGLNHHHAVEEETHLDAIVLNDSLFLNTYLMPHTEMIERTMEEGYRCIYLISWSTNLG